MKTVIVAFAKIGCPVRETSHQFGWLKTWQTLLSATVIQKGYTFEDLEEFDRIVIFNDMNSSSKALNYPGGCQEKTKDLIRQRVEALEKARDAGKLIRQTDYNQMFHTNFGSRKDTADLHVPSWTDEIQVVENIEFNLMNMAIGDSHSLSITPAGWACNRNDGQTLRGALKKGLKSFMTGTERKVAFSFGDIDLRFHFGRQDNPMQDIEAKLDEYYSQVCEIQRNGVEVWVKEAMPQMPDSRRIPGSGKFKERGSKEAVNFNGSLSERMKWTKAFNRGLNERFDNVINYDDYADEDGLLKLDRAEGGVNGGSVHLAPLGYNNKWEGTNGH